MKAETESVYMSAFACECANACVVYMQMKIIFPGQ